MLNPTPSIKKNFRPLTIMRRSLEPSSIVRPPRAHHHVLSVELPRRKCPGVRRRPQRVRGRAGDIPVGAAGVRPSGLMGRRAEVSSGWRRVLGHGSAAGNVHWRLLEVLMVESWTVVAVAAWTSSTRVEHHVARWSGWRVGLDDVHLEERGNKD